MRTPVRSRCGISILDAIKSIGCCDSLAKLVKAFQELEMCNTLVCSWLLIHAVVECEVGKTSSDIYQQTGSQ